MMPYGPRRLLRLLPALVVLAMVIFPPAFPDSSVTRISAGVLLVAAGVFFFLGAGEILRGISLSRRLFLTFFSVVLLWGLTGYAGSSGDIHGAEGDPQRAESIRDLGRRIDNVADVGSGQVRSFVDSMFTGQTGQLLGTFGEVTEAATGVLINAFLTSTTVDSSSLSDTTGTDTSETDGPITGVPPVRMAILAVSLFIAAMIQGFVYVDRSRTTMWLYRVTVAMMFIFAFLHVTGTTIVLTAGSKVFSGLELELPSIILLLLAMALGFCQRWAQYLSRKTRYLLLFAAFAVVVMMRNVYYWLAGNGCHGTGGLETAAAMVVAVYFLFAFITMFLQLPTARFMEKRSRELATLQDLSQALHSSFELDQLCAAAVRLGVKLTDSDVCIFHLSSGADYSHSRSAGLESLSSSLTPEWYTGVSRRIDATGGGFMLNNYRRSTLRKLEKPTEARSRIASLLAAPVEVRGERLGVLIAASSRQFFFLDYTRGLFESFTRQIAQAVQSARLFGERLHRQFLERELELARDIQKSLLPGVIPQPEGWEIEALSIPCRVMGGDYYDMIPMDGERLAVAIADVSGKGAAAAMLMAALQASLATILQEDLTVDGTVERLNRALCGRMPDDTFITCFLAFINTSTGRVDYCSAGHDPPLLCAHPHDGQPVPLEAGGIVLGVMPEAEYTSGTAEIPVSGRLLLFTDGVTETMAPEEEPFGTDRLKAYLRKHCGESADSIVEGLSALLESFRGDSDQTDDITMVSIVRTGTQEDQ